LSQKNQKRVDHPAQALQASLVPVCKMLVKRGLGAGELIETVKAAYIQAAVAEVVPAGSRINVSRLSVVSGLTRKEIAALLQSRGKSPAEISPKKSPQQRALRILHGWSVDPIFQKANGKPAELPMQGERQSFALLVRRYGSDVTPVSALRELERMKAVVVTSQGKVRFRRRTVDPSAHADQQMAEFGRWLKDFANTLQEVFGPKDPPPFFGFKDSVLTSPHQAALFQRTFAKRAATLLEGMDQWLAHQNKHKPSKSAEPKSKTRVGLGVYLVQEDG